MRSFTVKDKKTFTQQLFAGTAFDSFLLCEADFKTAYTIHIDGRTCQEFFDETDEPAEPFNSWSRVKPLCFHMIKGKRLPLYFKVVLCLSGEDLQNVLASADTTLTGQDVEGLYLNIHYKDGVLFCTSGISLRIFTMDRELIRCWDDLVSRFFTRNGFAWE